MSDADIGRRGRPQSGAREVIRLSRRQFGIVLVSVVLVIPVVLLLALPTQVYEFYLVAVWADRLEQEFGFRAGEVGYLQGGEQRKAFGIISVVEGGRLDAAGFLPGDIIFDYHGGGGAFLYEGLRVTHSGEPSIITVARRTGGGWERVELQVEPSGAR